MKSWPTSAQWVLTSTQMFEWRPKPIIIYMKSFRTILSNDIYIFYE